MPLPLLSNSYALLIAGLLAISSSVGQSENRDPYFTPTAAKSTSYHAAGDHSQHAGGSCREHLVRHVWRPDSL